MKKLLRIGTRSSLLALWQADKVKEKLAAAGYTCELVKLESAGDQDRHTPLHTLGGIGVFTRRLDEALLHDEVDLAVHSLKDVPTMLPDGIAQLAILPRGHQGDVLVLPEGEVPDITAACTIATGSIRRKAQWLSKYPHHRVVGLRGNVPTRLRKLDESDWQGAIFARAGLERLGLLPYNRYWELDWMLPAPGQGAIMVAARSTDMPVLQQAREALNDDYTEKMVQIERQFMRTLEGGCTSPIGALAKLVGSNVVFRGGVFSMDGTDKAVVSTERPFADDLGRVLAEEVLAQGGAQIIEAIRQNQESLG